MTNKKSIAVLLTGIFILFNFQYSHSCSSYKVTSNGKTLVGSNYDTWLTTPRIWFETNGYGAAFTGARAEGEGYFPQTGMNEFGLAYVSLSTATPDQGAATPSKKQITNRVNYLKDILHQCKTVDEVKIYIDQYDHSSFIEEVFLYVDKTGRYLIVEPYTMTFGNDSKYVLANFCPSTVADFSTIKQVRYINGTAFLRDKIDSSVAFCTALSDTMHVCRKKLGDGTLLTSILDLNEGITHLYFYHDYKHQVEFNLKEELAKGNHFIEIPPLFPPNEEFKKLTDFKTPLNSAAIDLFLRFCAGLFFISALFFLINYFRKRKSTPYAYIQLLLVPLSLVMLFYMFVLARVENIYYFPAPYTDGSLSMVSITSYIPFLILLLIIPLIVINRKVFSGWSFFPKWLFTLNNLCYVIFIVLFAYWGLYNVFN
jgi:hypothetical protein